MTITDLRHHRTGLLPAALVAVLFTMLATAKPALAADDCTLTELASLDVGYANGRMTVPVKIAGTDRRMLLDLGIADTGIRQSTADELHLAPRWITSNTDLVFYMGDRVTKEVTLPNVEMGEVRGKGVLALLFAGNRFPSNVDGVLGTALLENLDAEFDFAGNKVNLFSPDHCRGKVVYWTGSFASVPVRFGNLHQIYLDAKLDGGAIKTSLTTDGIGSRMMLSTANRLFGLTPETAGMTVTRRDDDGTPLVYRYAFKELMLGDLSIADPAIDILVDGPHTCDGGLLPSSRGWHMCVGETDLYLGFNVLRQLHLYFAGKEKTLYLAPAGASRSQRPSNPPQEKKSP